MHRPLVPAVGALSQEESLFLGPGRVAIVRDLNLVPLIRPLFPAVGYLLRVDADVHFADVLGVALHVAGEGRADHGLAVVVPV